MAARHRPGAGILRTTDLARAVGVHPNTVRVYESLGYLPPVRRSRGGHRRFTQRHLDHLRLARLLRGSVWPGRPIQRSAVALILRAANDGAAAVVTAASEHLALVRREQEVAAEARAIVQRWLSSDADSVPPGPGLRSGDAVRRLGVSFDTLRSWERNGLVEVRRDPASGERRFDTTALERITVIRALRTAGYSPMAILRMFHAADAGDRVAALAALIDPEIDPDLLSASDRWAATLADHERRALEAIDLIGRMASESRSNLP